MLHFTAVLSRSIMFTKFRSSCCRLFRSCWRQLWCWRRRSCYEWWRGRNSWEPYTAVWGTVFSLESIHWKTVMISVLSYMNVLWTSYELLLLADLDFVCIMYVKFMSLWYMVRSTLSYSTVCSSVYRLACNNQVWLQYNVIYTWQDQNY